MTSLEVAGGGICLAGGGGFFADRAMLASGLLPGGMRPRYRRRCDPPSTWAIRGHQGILKGGTGDESVLVVGTGLSMVDVVLGLAGLDRGPNVHAVSRHGLLPNATDPI